MSQLKQFVKAKLQHRVGPNVLADLDTYIFSSVMELQNKDMLPPRLLEFKSLEKKREWRTPDGEFQYNYYTLPEDFLSLDEFHTFDDGDPYFEVESETEIKQHRHKSRQFTITQKNVDKSVGWKDILIAKPFPNDDTIVRIKYYIDGSDTNWDWIVPKYWNAIVSQVSADLGIIHQEQADDVSHRAAYNNKNNTSKKKTRKKITPTFFGGRR